MAVTPSNKKTPDIALKKPFYYRLELTKNKQKKKHIYISYLELLTHVCQNRQIEYMNFNFCHRIKGG